MRFLSVFLPRLATDRLLRACGAKAREAPLAVYAHDHGGERLTAVNAIAQRRGIVPGLAVADARARLPALALAPADPAADRALLIRLADWHRRFTPLAAPDPPDGVVLDVAGAAHLFNGEEALMADIERRLAAQGFAARTALAPGPALARALARFSGQRIVTARATQGEIDAVAAALPVEALALDAAACAGLKRAGLRRVGDLLARPRAPLVARFGRALADRLDALTCRIRDPIAPRFEAPAFIAERRFPEGLTQRADIEATLRLLAADLCARLERAGVGARRLEAVFYRVDGALKHIAAGASRPLRDPARLAALLAERLSAVAEEGLDTGYGFDVLRLSASVVERCDAEQTALGARPDAGEDLADLLDRLGARLGRRRVLRLYPQETHAPEFAIAAAPAAFAPADAPAPAALTPQTAPRPLRLFAQPEPIEAMALAPDGPPLRFRWRRVLHEIVAYEGPERIAPPWWGEAQAAPTRDYFHAQDRQGLSFWLYREGLYHETDAPRWFVHGLS